MKKFNGKYHYKIECCKVSASGSFPEIVAEMPKGTKITLSQYETVIV